MQTFKTIFLMVFLTLILIWIGGMFGGKSGMMIAFLFAAAMNFYSYFFSDKLYYRTITQLRLDQMRQEGFLR